MDHPKDFSKDPPQFRERFTKQREAIGAAEGLYRKLLACSPDECPLCGRQRPSYYTPESFFVIDHDHATGFVRGLICNRCNVNLGRLENSIELIDVYKDYLREPLAYKVIGRVTRKEFRRPRGLTPRQKALKRIRESVNGEASDQGRGVMDRRRIPESED